jgi:hypothetical protein
MPITLSAINLKRGVTAALYDYRNKTDQFVADYVAPVVSVGERTSAMPKFTNVHMKVQDFRVSLTGMAHNVDVGTTSTTYTCEDHSAETRLTTRMVKSDTAGLITAGNLAVRVDEAMRLQKENDVATVLTAMSAHAVGTKWNTTGGNAPKDIATIQATVFALINRLPMHGLATIDTALEMRVICGQVYGRQTSDLPSLEDVAKWVGLKEIRIAMASYDSTKPGKTTSFSTLFGTKGFWTFYKPETMDSSLPAFMATPRFDELSKPRVYPIVQPEGFGIEVNDCYDLVTVDSNAGYYSTAVI